MAKVIPFYGILPKVEDVEKVAAVPYDVINTEEAKALAAGNPLSFLHVSRPEIDLPEGTDLHADCVYEKAAENYKKLCKEAPLTPDSDKHIYIYQLKMGDHTQVGIVGAASTDDYDADIIKKHEKTRQDKEDDRARHVMTLRSHTGPVFLTYEDDAKIDTLVAEIMNDAPLFDFTAEDGIQHTLWRADVKNSEQLSELFDAVPYLYIADGHHRGKSASRAAETCRAANPNHTGEEDYNYFLSVTFPASQLKILPYNRALKTMNGHTQEELMATISENFTIEPISNPIPGRPTEICMYTNGEWFILKPTFDVDALGVIGSLDVSILQDNILTPFFGIDDPRTSTDIDFIGGIRGTDELEKLVNSGSHVAAFSMYPTTVEQLIAIANAGEIMPPKSTWFEPKLRDGIVLRDF